MASTVQNAGLNLSRPFLLQIADLRGLQRTAWMKVASDEGLPFPRLEHHVYDITPERAIMQVGMHWHACVVPPCTCRMHSNPHFASFETGQQQRSLLFRC